MEDNRRKSERVNISLEVLMESSSGNREVRISDLSMDGCFVDNIAIMPHHENVSLKVRMPTGEWIVLNGEVVSVFPGIGFGVRFADLSEEEQDRLKQIILDRGGQP